MSGFVLAATDEDVTALSAPEAVATMLEAVRAHGRGELHAPVRATVALGDGSHIFTVGRSTGTASGFRLVSTLAESAGEITLVTVAGESLPRLVVGRGLGRRRTGALGGVAAALCARPDAANLGIIGAGEQAFTQLWAIAAVRPLGRVRLANRSSARAEQFALRAASELGIEVEVHDDADDVAAGSEILVMATPATAPLIDADAVRPGTHVHTLGPKGPQEGECPRRLLERAALLVSDSPDQLLAMEGEDRPWSGEHAFSSLGDIAVGRVPGRARDTDITVYASVGLAGTEVLFAHRLFQLLDAQTTMSQVGS